MKPYIPQPGTIPARAIDYLRSLGPGAELSSAELAEALGCEPNITAFLGVPRKYGAVRSRFKGSRHIAYWSLGDGTPLPPPEDHEKDEPLNPAPDRPSAPALPALAPTPNRKPDHFRAGRFMDGTLLVEIGYRSFTLDKGQAMQLRDFLA